MVEADDAVGELSNMGEGDKVGVVPTNWDEGGG